MRSLPHRQLRKLSGPNSSWLCGSLPHRQLRKLIWMLNAGKTLFTAAQAAQKNIKAVDLSDIKLILPKITYCHCEGIK